MQYRVTVSGAPLLDRGDSNASLLSRVRLLRPLLCPNHFFCPADNYLPFYMMHGKVESTSLTGAGVLLLLWLIESLQGMAAMSSDWDGGSNRCAGSTRDSGSTRTPLSCRLRSLRSSCRLRQFKTCL